MANDPSMTITSTAPASEGSDNTSREGKTIPRRKQVQYKVSFY